MELAAFASFFSSFTFISNCAYISQVSLKQLRKINSISFLYPWQLLIKEFNSINMIRL